MPVIDATLTFTVIIAFAAIVSPIFVAIINNKYNLSIRKIEYADQNAKRALERETSEYEANVLRERQLYYDFLSSCSALIAYDSAENRTIYGKLYPLVLIRLESNLAKEVEALNTAIKRGVVGQADSVIKLNILIPKIREIIKDIK